MKEVTIDGKTYEYDSSRLMSSEMKVIQKYTGMTYAEWNAALGSSDLEALDALVWLVRSRSGETDAIGEYDYDIKAVTARDLDAETEVEVDPTQATSGGSSQESTTETPTPSS